MTRPRSPRLVLSPLWLLIALLTTLGLNASSAAAAGGPETRVRAIPTVTAAAVGHSSSETAGGVGQLRPSQPGVVSGSCVATEAVDDLAGAVSRPAGVADDFVSEVANNGKGTVWRAPGTTGNGGTVRIMEPTAQYPNGYVRFYNEGGQPLSLNGKPGPNSATHIPINPDGTYPLPKGWGGAG